MGLATGEAELLDDDRNVAHRRTEIGEQGVQRVVNRLFERIVETQLRTPIHLRNDARIGAGIDGEITDAQSIAAWALFLLVPQA